MLKNLDLESDPRFPYTYAIDFVRSVTGIKSRVEAGKIIQEKAEDHCEKYGNFCKKLAMVYLQTIASNHVEADWFKE